MLLMQKAQKCEQENVFKVLWCILTDAYDTDNICISADIQSGSSLSDVSSLSHWHCPMTSVLKNPPYWAARCGVGGKTIIRF